MSVYYDIKEHIIIKNTAEHEETRDIFSYRLVCLAKSLLLNSGKIHNLTVIADGKKRELSGTTVTAKFHNIIRAIDKANSLEIVADYGYYHYTSDVKGPDVCDIADHLDERIKEEGSDCLNGLFYSIYNNADCSDDAGIVLAYGEKNGTLYTGKVEGKTVDALPDGVWHSPQTAVICDPMEDGLTNVEEIEPICREMTKFSSYDELEVDEGGISFYLNNLELHNNDELNKFVGLCKKLLEATNGEACASELGLTDLYSNDARIITVKINDDGTQEIVLYSAE